MSDRATDSYDIEYVKRISYRLAAAIAESLEARC